MKLRIWTGLTVSALLAALLLTGCDTVSHGSPPAKADPPKLATPATSTDGDTTDDDAAPAQTDGEQLVSATDANAEAVTAEPMPPPVRDDGKVIDISFDDLNLRMQADVVYRPFFLDNNPRVKELEGRRVRITGAVYPPEKPKGLDEFVLLKNIQCKFGPGGQADHLVIVKLKKGVKFDYLGDQPVSVEGVLRLNPFQGLDGFTWSIYDLEAADNVTIRR